MADPTTGDTQPVRVSRQPAETPEPVKISFPPSRGNFRVWLWVFFILALLTLSSVIGALAGYQYGNHDLVNIRAQQQVLNLVEQYYQGLEDFNAGRYRVAQQRFEYILSKDANFPGAAEHLAQVYRILSATPTLMFTPTQLPTKTPTLTPTLTPTRDLRPVQELLSLVEEALRAGDWTGAIETILALRSEEATFATVEVDGMLFIALRSRGVERIMKGGDLEGGSYDLSLAERFGPVDARAEQARELARLYMYGSAFWEAYPAQAVYYFGQVALAAPYLTDASGWTARDRYRASLIHYGDQLASQGDWCAAQAQYALAESIYSASSLQPTLAFASLQCSPPTATQTPTPTPTLTGTASQTPTIVWTGTATHTPTPLATTTFTPIPPTATGTNLLPTLTDTPGETQVSPTSTSTLIPTASETATPSAVIPTPTDTPTSLPLTSTLTETLVPPSETPLPSETPTPPETETPQP